MEHPKQYIRFSFRLLDLFKRNLSDLVKKLPTLHKAKSTIEISDKEKFEIIKRFTETLKSKLSNKIDTIDGIGIQLEDGWVLIRASNTSPLIRITTEAETSEKAETLLIKFSSLLKDEINKFIRE